MRIGKITIFGILIVLQIEKILNISLFKVVILLKIINFPFSKIPKISNLNFEFTNLKNDQIYEIV